MSRTRCVAAALLLAALVCQFCQAQMPVAPASSLPAPVASSFIIPPEWVVDLHAPSIVKIICDPEDNVYVLCEGATTDLLGAPPPDNDHQYGSLAKFTASGELLWSKWVPFKSAWGEVVMCCDDQGNLFVFGRAEVAMAPPETLFPPDERLPFADMLAEAGECGLLAKLDPSGSVLWQRRVGFGRCAFRDGTIALVTMDWDPAGSEPTQDDCHVLALDYSGSILWTRVLGGSHIESAHGVCIDSECSILVYGGTGSSDFPLLSPFDATWEDLQSEMPLCSPSDASELFIAKFDSGGTMCWSSFLGGRSYDLDGVGGYGALCVVDSGNNLYIAGVTHSPDFPVLNGFLEDPGAAGFQAFAAKITTDGGLAWSTFCIPAMPNAEMYETYGPIVEIVPDGAGNLYMLGSTGSPEFPVVGGFDTRLNADGEYGDAYGKYIRDMTLLKLDPEGGILWSTYLGGSGDDSPSNGLNPSSQMSHATTSSWAAPLPGGGVIVAAPTWSSDFPLHAPFQDQYGGSGSATTYFGSDPDGVTMGWGDAFLSIFSPSGDLAFSTYMGSSGGDILEDTALDGAGAVYVGILTASTEWPTPHAADPRGYVSAFLIKGSTVPPDELAIRTRRLPKGFVGAPYSAAIEVTGDTPPFAWEILRGSLPDGLSLSALTGTITGTPTRNGTWRFTVRVRDAYEPARDVAIALSILVVTDNDPPVTADMEAPDAVRERLDSAFTLFAVADDTGKGDSLITAAEYFVDGTGAPGSGTGITPVDGVFDSAREQFSLTIDTSAWRAPASHDFRIRAQDETGRWGDFASVLVDVIDVLPPGPVSDLSIEFSYLHELAAASDWHLEGLADASLQSTIIDIGSQKPVVGVSLAPETVLTYFPRSFSIWASSDGANWTCVARQADWRPVKLAALWQCEPITARYVKLDALPILNRKLKTYAIAVKELKVYTTDTANPITFRWTATDEDASTDTNPSSQYDLGIGFNWLQLPASDLLEPLSTDAPMPPGEAEEVRFDLGWRFGLLWASLKSCDADDNWSILSSSPGTYILPYGFQPSLPEEAFTVNSVYASQFSFYRGEGLKQVKLAFSDRPDFPNRAIRQEEFTSKTIRFPLRFKDNFWWKPTVSQWKTMLRLGANSSRLYWRIEGKDASNAPVIGPTRSITVP